MRCPLVISLRQTFWLCYHGTGGADEHFQLEGVSEVADIDGRRRYRGTRDRLTSLLFCKLKNNGSGTYRALDLSLVYDFPRISFQHTNAFSCINSEKDQLPRD